MIANQISINTAIAAIAIRNSKAVNRHNSKTNKFNSNSNSISIVENRYNRIKKNILTKHLKSDKNMSKFITINVYLGETSNGEKKYGNIILNPNYIEQLYIKEYEEQYVSEYECEYEYTALEELKENKYIMKYLDKDYELTKDSYNKLCKALTEDENTI